MWYFAIVSPLPPLELAHVIDQRLHALDRHRVVDRCAHAADGAVPLELHHAALLRALDKGLVELLVAQPERHVHARAVFLANRARIEFRLVEAVVEEPRLGYVLPLDRRETALAQQPFEYEPCHVDWVACRRVSPRRRR